MFIKSTRSLVTLAVIAASSGYVNYVSADNKLIEEVIVTAQNRQQDVQDVPISMDVVGNEAIMEAGFGDFKDIERIAPSVQIKDDQGAMYITMRGIGTTSGDEAQDTSVVVNIDGEYINRPQVLNLAVFDLDRVEVLHGPQGTLYGRNSTGGAINFVTRKPGKEFEFNAALTTGNYGTTDVDLGISVPISENAGMRLAMFKKQHDGYYTHTPHPIDQSGNTSYESNDNDMQGGRATLVFDPSDDLSLTLQIETAEKEFTPNLYATADLHQPQNTPGAGCANNGFEKIAPNYGVDLCIPVNTNFLAGIDREAPYFAPAFGAGRLYQDTDAYRFRADYQIDESTTLSYIMGARESNTTGRLTLPVIYQNFTHDRSTDTESHELRLNGNMDNGGNYQLGAFYFTEKLNVESGFFIQFIGPNGSYLDYFNRKVDSESTSLFGQVEIPLAENLMAVGGLRYTDNSRSAIYKNNGPFGPFGPTPLFNAGSARPAPSALTNVALDLGNDEQETTWLAGLNYTPDEQTLIYGKVSTGFKGGGFDAVGPYKPEKNTAYEVGYKSEFGDQGQYRLNASAFMYDYQDLQVSVLLNTETGGQTFNAGEASIQGFELDGEFQVSDNGLITLGVNYLDAEFDKFLGLYNAYCVDCDPDITGVGDLDPTTATIEQPNFAGNRPANSPEWVISAGYRHITDLGDNGSLTTQISSRFKDDYFIDYFNYNDAKQDAFTQTDIMLKWTSESERLSVMLFGRNLEDERPLVAGGFVAAGPDDIFNFQFGTPRTYGLTIAYDM